MIVVVDPVERMGENVYIVVLETSRLFRSLFQMLAANTETLRVKKKHFERSWWLVGRFNAGFCWVNVKKITVVL